MARIPLGDFGTLVAAPERAAAPPQGAFGEQIGQAVQRLGAVVSDAATSAIRAQRQREDELQRSRAANSLAEHEYQTGLLTHEIGQKLASGEITREDARTRWDTESLGIESRTLEGIAPDYREAAGANLTNVRRRYGLNVIQALDTHQAQEFADLFTSTLDTLGKEAGLPGADVAAINARADTLIEQARLARIPEPRARAAIQALKDGNWYAQAQQRALLSADSPAALKQLRHELTAKDGFYAGKLDADKRNGLLRAVIADQDRLQVRAQIAADRREARAERALGQLETLLSTGQPVAPAAYAKAAESVRGTGLEADYRALLQDGDEIQRMLGMPLAEQQAYVVQRNEELRTAGIDSVSDVTRNRRLNAAFEANLKQMTQEPLAWHAQRTGEDVSPVDFAQLLQPDGAAAIEAQLGERAATVRAVATQSGSPAQVRTQLLLPQERTQLKAVLDQARDSEKVQVMAVLARTMRDDPRAYTTTVRELAGEDSALALAGVAEGRGLRTDKGSAVSGLLLRGRAVLADKSTPKPQAAQLRQAFEDHVGLALPAGATRDAAFEAAQSVYAELNKGEASETLNTERFRAAVDIVTGGVAEHNGVRVVKPYGMSDDDFESGVQTALDALPESGYNRSRLRDLPIMEAEEEGAYWLMEGLTPIVDPRTGAPLTIRPQPPGRRGPGARPQGPAL